MQAPTRRIGEYLSSLGRASWFAELDPEDQIRAAKVIAYAASQLEGALPEQAEIIVNTLDALMSERFELSFETLPFDEDKATNGFRRLPRTVVLNRSAIPADDRPIEGYRQQHVALATLVHEINHLANDIPEGPTYAAFQDEYRAWYVAFFASMARAPRAVEAHARCKELLQDPEYSDIQEASGLEAQRIAEFLRNFEDTSDYLRPAPLPDPKLNMTN